MLKARIDVLLLKNLVNIANKPKKGNKYPEFALGLN